MSTLAFTGNNKQNPLDKHSSLFRCCVSAKEKKSLNYVDSSWSKILSGRTGR